MLNASSAFYEFCRNVVEKSENFKIAGKAILKFTDFSILALFLNKIVSEREKSLF